MMLIVKNYGNFVCIHRTIFDFTKRIYDGYTQCCRKSSAPILQVSNMHIPKMPQ